MADELETLGKYLKNQRESKNISLRELAKSTRVREPILRAIEDDRHELLPPPTYVKGFLAAYARYLKLDENDVLLRYERVLKGEPVAPPRAELAKPEEKILPVMPPPDKVSTPPPPQPERKTPRPRVFWKTKPTWVVAGVIAASFIVLYFFSPFPLWPPEPVSERTVLEEPIPQKPIKEKVATAEKAAAEESPVSPSPPVPGATAVSKGAPVIKEKESPPASSPAASTTMVPERKPISLQLKAVEETWVSIELDDQPGKEMIFKPGEGISVEATNRIRMILGNAGGLDLTLNGKALEKFGKSGEVFTLIFTSKGVEIKRPVKPSPPKE